MSGFLVEVIGDGGSRAAIAVALLAVLALPPLLFALGVVRLALGRAARPQPPETR